MVKICVDYNSLKNNSLYDINNALSKLKEAVYDIGTINVPYEFGYAYYVKNIFDKNLSTYNKLLAKKNKLQKIVNTFKLIEKNNTGIIDKIKVDDLNYRKKIVN